MSHVVATVRRCCAVRQQLASIAIACLKRTLLHATPHSFPARVLHSGSYLKREGRPRDDDVLVARLVDRPLRPMLEKGWCNETQVRECLVIRLDRRDAREHACMRAQRQQRHALSLST